MAAVRGDERSQLLLVASIGLAVTLVALALILNSVIYTGNLASRAAEPGVADAVTTRHVVVRGLGGVMDGVNDPNTATDYPTLESNYQTGLAAWRREQSRYAALQGESIRVATATTGAGTPIINRGVQVVDTNRSSTLTPRGDTPVDWTVGASVRARQMQFVINDTLATPSDADVETELSAGTWTEGTFFSVDIDDGEWRMAVYGDGSGNVKVAVYDNATGSFAVCPGTPAAPPVRINVGEGTVNGIHCEALSTVGGQTGPYDIHFANGDQVKGEYELTVDRVIDDPGSPAGPFTDEVDRLTYGRHCDGPTYYAAGSGTSPRVAPALYSSAVEVHVRSQSVEYHTTARVATDELSDGASSPHVASVTVDDQSDASLTEQARFSTDWTVTDPTGDLASVTVELLDSGSVQATASTSVSGRTGSGTLVVKEDLPLGAVYEVRITTTDAAGNTRTVTQTHEAEDGGNDTGCPP